MPRHLNEKDFHSCDPMYKEDGTEMTLLELQKRVMQNKKNKGFNTTDLMKEFTYLVGEFGELAEAIKNPEREDLEEALVDMMIFIFGMFEIMEVDSYKEVLKKMMINEGREFTKSETGYEIRKSGYADRVVENVPEGLTFTKIQERILENKKNKGFNTDASKIEKEYVCIGEEISELFIALRKDRREESIDALTDLFIYLVGIVAMRGSDSYKLVTQKMNLNEGRVYQKTTSGEFDKVLT